MGQKFTNIRIDWDSMTTVAMTEKGDVYARPNVPAWDSDAKRMEWRFGMFGGIGGWQFMGNILDGAAHASTGSFRGEWADAGDGVR